MGGDYNMEKIKERKGDCREWRGEKKQEEEKKDGEQHHLPCKDVRSHVRAGRDQSWNLA